MRIVVDDLSGPAIAEFLAEHVRQMRSITPLESKYALDLDGLRRPGITFWKLYEKFGFDYCGPFAGYRPSPHNTFMTRAL